MVKRVKDHNNPKNNNTKYTRGRRPVKLVYFENKETLTEALKKEGEIKKLTKEKKELLVQCFKKRSK